MYLAFSSEELSGSADLGLLTRVVNPSCHRSTAVAPGRILGGQTSRMRLWLDQVRWPEAARVAERLSLAIDRKYFQAGRRSSPRASS